MQDRTVRVGGILSVLGSLIVNEVVGWDPGGDQESGNTGEDVTIVYWIWSSRYIPNAQTGKVVGDMVVVGHASKGDAIFRLRNVHWWRDVVCEAAVLVKVDNE